MPSLADLKDFATMISLLLAAWVAVAGLRRWQEQVQGEKEYGLAYKIITCTFHISSELKFMSGAFAAISEGAKVDDSYLNTRKRLRELISEFEVSKVEAEAIWQDGKLNDNLNGLWALAMITDIILVKSITQIEDKELADIKKVLQETGLDAAKYRELVDNYVGPISKQLQKRLRFRARA